MSPHSPPFLVITGAHGVGKTTVLAACNDWFVAKGIAVTPFHHIAVGAPGKATPNGHETETAAAAPARRGVWGKLVPTPLKLIVVTVLDELRYIHGITRILRRAAAEQRVAIADRYVYDRLVALRLRGRPPIQRAAVRITCSLLRHPTLTILLTDRPDAIHARKQEMTVDEIRRYHDELVTLCQELGIPFIEVPVAGRDPDMLAADIGQRILETLGKRGFTRADAVTPRLPLVE